MRERKRNHRSAESGQYVTAEAAQANKATTVSEPRSGGRPMVVAVGRIEVMQDNTATIDFPGGAEDLTYERLPKGAKKGSRVRLTVEILD